jgi:DNA polymerase I
MPRLWLLDVFIKNGETIFSLYDENTKSIEERVGKIDFYGYIEASNPTTIAKELEHIEDVEDVHIERWRKPPFYTNSIDIVVFKTKNFNIYRDIIRIGVSKELKFVNTFPHPLVEALYKTGIQPLTIVVEWRKDKPLTSDWKPDRIDPEVEYIAVDFQNGFYVVETSKGIEKFWYIEDLIRYIESNKFLIGFTNPYIYTQIMNFDLRVAKTVYRWITSGSHHPFEYFEWSRLSYTPLNLMKNITIGKILTTIEALIARDKKYIVDRSYGRVEPWRNIGRLILHDRGGVVYQPKPGLYWGICQIDFRSLYPSIIVKYNISGETVDKPLCSRSLKLTWCEHSVCLDEEGVVPMSIKKLIELKDLYEDKAREVGDKLFDYRRRAVKWILVASFGYLGYRNALLGSVMAHETVTSTSREILRKARVAIEKKGYRVIHAMVDSLFIEGVEDPCECKYIKNIVEETTGFKAKVEAYFLWLYIPKLLNSDRGASNKYYGLLQNGKAKIKGILAVRKDTPPIIKKAQLEAIEKLLKAYKREEFIQSIKEAHNIINNYIEKLKQNNYNLRDLVITRYPSVRENYRKPPKYIRESLPPYRLIYTKKGLIVFKDPTYSDIDINKYVDFLEKARKELPTEKELQ